MSDEMEQALAQIFLKKGKGKLTEKEFVFAASLDLRWFSPKAAQKFLDIGIESELLERDGDQLLPAFDYKGTTLKTGFSPSPDILKVTIKPKGIFMKIVDEISVDKDVPRNEVISEINNLQDEMGIDIEVAALIVSRSHGLDIKPHLDTVEEDVAARYKQK